MRELGNVREESRGALTESVALVRYSIYTFFQCLLKLCRINLIGSRKGSKLFTTLIILYKKGQKYLKYNTPFCSWDFDRICWVYIRSIIWNFGCYQFEIQISLILNRRKRQRKRDGCIIQTGVCDSTTYWRHCRLDSITAKV